MDLLGPSDLLRAWAGRPGTLLIVPIRYGRSNREMKDLLMTTLRLEDHLKSLVDKFEMRKKFLIFNNLHYRSTGEKVVFGFRYFDCPIDGVVDAFRKSDFDALDALPFALDEDGDVDTSGVLIDLAYTESGAFIAAQPVEYQNYNPTPVAESFVLEGDAAKAVFARIKGLDQSA
jgi:hypothetical protein